MALHGFFWALASGCLSSLLEPVLEVLEDWHNCEFRLRTPKLHDQVMDFFVWTSLVSMTGACNSVRRDVGLASR